MATIYNQLDRIDCNFFISIFVIDIMQFEPIGGFPSIIRVDDDNINEKTLESRGFATKNIVSIRHIMDLKKKENLFMAFGSDEEDGIDFQIDAMFTENPHDYKDIAFNSVPKKR